MRKFQNATQPDDERVVKEKRKEKKLESRDTLFGKEGVLAAAPDDCFFFDAVPFFPIFSFVLLLCETTVKKYEKMQKKKKRQKEGIFWCFGGF